MKTKHLLSVILLALPVLSIAQPTIVQGDFPVPGTVWVEFNDERDSSHTVTAPGPSQTWNYSTAFIVSDTTVVNFILPSSTPASWAANFPAATVAVYSPADTTAQYFKSLPDGFYADGIYTGSVTSPIPVLDVNPDQLLVPGNFSYNDTRNHYGLIVFDQPPAPPTPAIRFKIYFMEEFTGDAYGSLVTPAGSFPNVLRVKSLTYVIDSTFMDILGTGNYTFVNSNGPSDTSIAYNFIKNAPGALLMTIEQDGSTLQSTSASYFGTGPVGLNDPQSSSGLISVYPNPVASAFVNFDINYEKAAVVRITNISGQLVQEVNVKGLNRLVLQTSTFEKGVYFYDLLDENGRRLNRGKFVVIR
jgi:hypothetical protein